jgi:G3E family GTPase
LKLLVIAGFLGSGKTTLILSLAGKLMEKNKRVVIIENEAGEVGVDGEYLKKSGLLVQELYTGCVCCQLAGDLISTLARVEEQFQPDIAMVEPSGIARLGSLLNVLRGYGGGLDGIRVLSLIDIRRFDTLMQVVSPLITSHVEDADLVAINKVDDVPQEQIDQVIRRLSEIRADVDALPLSASRGINMDTLFERLMS